MQRNRFQRIVTTAIFGLILGLSGCSAADAPASAATDGAASQGPPSGAYTSRMADGTAIRIDFRSGGSAVIAMTEDGQTTSQDAQWVQNGEVFHVEGAEGLTLELARRGDALVTDFGGLTMTFMKN